MVGETDYIHVGEIDDPKYYGCTNGCVYKSVYGNPNSQYCFKPGPLNSECVSRIPSLGDFGKNFLDAIASLYLVYERE